MEQSLIHDESAIYNPTVHMCKNLSREGEIFYLTSSKGDHFS